MMTSSRWSVGFTTAAIAASWSGRAMAVEGADDLVTRGLALRVEHRDEEALRLFRSAYALVPTPRTRAQIAFAEQALGDWAKAEADMVAAMASPNDPWIASRASTLSLALETVRRHLGSLEVHANVADAELLVDGHLTSRLPQASASRIAVGRHVVEVRAQGFHPLRRSIDVEPGAELRERFELVTIPPAESRIAATMPRSQMDHAGSLASGSTQRWLGWSLLGIGLASGVVSSISFVVRDGAINSYNVDASCPGRAAASQPASCADKITAADRWLTVGVATAISGAVLVIGGVVLAVTARPTDRARISGVSCGAAGCGLRF